MTQTSSHTTRHATDCESVTLTCVINIKQPVDRKCRCSVDHRAAVCALQNALARKLPFCYATMLGSHNSGITLADGYGTLDPYFQKYFEWVKFAVSAVLVTLLLSASFLIMPGLQSAAGLRSRGRAQLCTHAEPVHRDPRKQTPKQRPPGVGCRALRTGCRRTTRC